MGSADLARSGTSALVSVERLAKALAVAPRELLHPGRGMK